MSTTVGFDHTLLVEMCNNNNFQSARERVAFILMAGDYMAYVRSPMSGTTEVELQTARVFAEKIRSEQCWPVVCQVAPEFKSAIEEQVLQELPLPLRIIVGAVKDKLPPSPDERRIKFSSKQQAEEDQLWRKWCHRIKYLGYLQKQCEVDANITDLNNVMAATEDVMEI